MYYKWAFGISETTLRKVLHVRNNFYLFLNYYDDYQSTFLPFTCIVKARARTCKNLRSPGIYSEESIPSAYVAWRATTSNRVVVPARQAGNRFLDSLKGLQILALRPDCTFREPVNPTRKRGFLYVPAERPGSPVWRGHAENPRRNAASPTRNVQV